MIAQSKQKKKKKENWQHYGRLTRVCCSPGDIHIHVHTHEMALYQRWNRGVFGYAL